MKLFSLPRLGGNTLLATAKEADILRNSSVFNIEKVFSIKKPLYYFVTVLLQIFPLHKHQGLY